MIDYDGIRKVIVKGLKEYLKCPVVRSNQNADMPEYPFISYTITTVKSQNKGTHGEYADGTKRKPHTQTWSITAVSNDNTESVTLAAKAHEWLDLVGTTYMSDNDVVVQSVGGINNRDNFLTVEYEYRNGFDMFLSLFDTVGSTEETDGVIETFELGNKAIEKTDYEALNDKLEQRLNGEVI